MRWILAFFALLFAYVAEAADTGHFVATEVESTTVGKTRITVWLPPGYDKAKARRYPVLYMHDGQNLFDPKRSNMSKVWAADRAAITLIAARKIAPFIIVGVDQPGEARYRTYFPTKVAPGPLRAGIEGFAKGPLIGDAQVAFLADTLKPLIDRTYRTRPDRLHTAVAGSSMGGLISLYALAERPDVFGKAAAISTHSILVDPATAKMMAPLLQQAWQGYLAQSLGAPRGRKLWMDRGTVTLDQHYGPFQDVIDREIERLGWTRGTAFESKVYEGAGHEEDSWAARLPDVLGWLLADWKA